MDGGVQPVARYRVSGEKGEEKHRGRRADYGAKESEYQREKGRRPHHWTDPAVQPPIWPAEVTPYHTTNTKRNLPRNLEGAPLARPSQYIYSRTHVPHIGNATHPDAVQN